MYRGCTEELLAETEEAHVLGFSFSREKRGREAEEGEKDDVERACGYISVFVHNSSRHILLLYLLCFG